MALLTTGSSLKEQTTGIRIAILVAALGYFVDIYDLILFGIIREASLISIGVTSSEAITSESEFLLGIQMFGLLVGGIFWGILGDKKGRLSVLFGSILLYSMANIANGFVQSVEMYALLRFVAGLGLAGELGAGVTLVSEMMPKETRGWGTTLIATFGLLGAVVAGFVGTVDWTADPDMNWRIAYFVGGGLGIVLLLLRIGVFESGMFAKMKEANVRKGNFLSLFTKWDRFKRYAQAILIGVPIWFVVGIIVFFTKEFAIAMNLSPEIVKNVENPTAIMLCYGGLATGDLLSGVISQLLKSRKRAVWTFMGFTFGMTLLFLNLGNLNLGLSLISFYAFSFFMGFGTGYWAVFMMNAAEQFGTNIRSTVTTTVPNFVRGSLELVIIIFAFLRAGADWLGFEGIGRVNAAMILAFVIFGVAFTALAAMQETFGKDLDYFED